MNIVDIESLLKKYLNQNNKILFYPSSGELKENIFSLAYDAFILSDNNHSLSHDFNLKNIQSCESLLDGYEIKIFKISEKILFFCFADNNVILEAMSKSLIKITCLVSVNDGCCEGGNDECINRNSWLCQAFDLFPDYGGMYITDHYIGDSLANNGSTQDFSRKEFQKLTIGRWIANQTHNFDFNKKVNEIFKPQFSDLTVVYEIRRKSH